LRHCFGPFDDLTRLFLGDLIGAPHVDQKQHVWIIKQAYF
jgi:hypothetical protein